MGAVRKFSLRDERAATVALVGYALLNAVCYASLLPLWEGFDEPFHYASVQTASRSLRLPTLNRTGVSDEIRASLALAPASVAVRANLPGVTTYSEFFRLEPGERARRVAALRAISPATGFRIPDDGTNYEAQQAPLAYVLLAPFDRLWAGVALPARVWRLRMVCGMAGAGVAVWATVALARALRLGTPFAQAAGFIVASSQMLYAAAAHVANDWLAVALAPVFLLSAVRYSERPSARRAALLGTALTAGLLAKAYFLAFVPLAVILALRHRRGFAAFVAPVLLLAVPWYARNRLLYGNIAGVMDTVGRLGLRDIVETALSMPWPSVLAASARRALWTANNSFDAFSSTTLNAMLALCAAGAGFYARAVWRDRGACAQRILIAAVLLFSAAMAWSTAALFQLMGPIAVGGAPWYVAAIFPAIFIVLSGGLERSGRAGRIVLALMLVLWTYVIAATWWVKLIPLYGGYEGPARPSALAAWYRGGVHMLGSTALVPPAAILALASAAALAALTLGTVLGMRVLVSPPPAEPCSSRTAPAVRA